MKSAFISLIGRPSSGKSTLLNTICQHKVSIVSNVPQTTRNKIRGIYNDKRGQLIFIDTPGYHNSLKKFNLHLKKLIYSALKEVDIVLYLIDVTRSLGQEEQDLMDLISNFQNRLLIAFNKLDIMKNYLIEIREFVKQKLGNVLPVNISCLSGKGIKELLNELFRLAPEGEQYYPSDLYTDQEPEFRISEILREKVIRHTSQEIPHAVYIEIADLEMKKQKNLLWVRGFICIERESQKGILIGKGGAKIKTILGEAEREINALFPYKVSLDFRVRVRRKWRKNEKLLKRIFR